ncbi:hypothetical protein YC2023_066482 [Brassica napus]
MALSIISMTPSLVYLSSSGEGVEYKQEEEIKRSMLVVDISGLIRTKCTDGSLVT